MQDPTKLSVYCDALDFANKVYRLARAFDHRDARARDQLLGSSTSVGANLAEFCSMEQHGAKTEKLRRCIGENFETQFWLELCRDQKLISPTDYEVLIEHNTRIRKQMFGLLNAVVRTSSK